ncbi:MAG TPA: hypothetical protein VM537_29665 [Anaerolineae bacterium]|nr:hypothetical protein [Anaerolineae bacterium]
MRETTLVLEDGETETPFVDLNDARLMVIEVPAGFSGTEITLKHARSGTSMATNQHDGTTETPITFSVTAGEAYIPIGDLALAVATLDRFTITSDASQVGDVSFELQFKHLYMVPGASRR